MIEKIKIVKLEQRVKIEKIASTDCKDIKESVVERVKIRDNKDNESER